MKSEHTADKKRKTKYNGKEPLAYKYTSWILSCVTVLLLVFFLAMRYIESSSEKIIVSFSSAEAENYSVQNNTAEALLININTAGKDELTKLNGIGDTKAQAIIEYRNEYGRFTDIAEIKNVKGIGDKLFEKIKDFICVD